MSFFANFITLPTIIHVNLIIIQPCLTPRLQRSIRNQKQLRRRKMSFTPIQKTHRMGTQSSRTSRPSRPSLPSNDYHCNKIHIFFLYSEVKIPFDPSTMQCTVETYLTHDSATQMRLQFPDHYLKPPRKTKCPSCVSRVEALKTKTMAEWQKKDWYISYNPDLKSKKTRFTNIQGIHIVATTKLPNDTVQEYKCFRCQYWKAKSLEKFVS